MSRTGGPRASRLHPVVLFALVGAAVALLAACAPRGDEAAIGAQPPAQPSIYPLPPPAVESPIADTAASTPGAVAVRTADGVALPDPVATPGAVFADVVAADICELHYTQGVRQPQFNAKVEAFAQYGVSIRDRDLFQVDHLIPVVLGGSNEDGNLWPQPYGEAAGAEQKDLLERQLRGLVCTGTLTLPEAQQAIATNWWAAYQSYMGLPINPGSEGPEPWKPPQEPAPGEVVNGALCTQEGAIGYTEPKRIRLICAATNYGELRWQKRN